MSEYKWEKVWDGGSKDIDGNFYGHTVFRDKRSGRYAIADMSGDTPESTDDGVLWIDCTRPAYLCVWENKITALIPLLSNHGDKTHTTAASTKLRTLLELLPSLRVVADDEAKETLAQWQSVLNLVKERGE